MNKLRSLLLASASFCCIVALGQKSITERTYWIDGDYASPTTLGVSVDISSLAAGMHSLTMRVKDSEGLWSSPVTKYFIIPSYVADATEIAEREYWLDGKLADRSALGTSEAIVDLGGLGSGVHSFAMRVKNDAGVWSSPVTKYFIIPSYVADATEIASREYWLDGKLADRADLGTSEAIVDLSGLSPGMHSFSMRVKNDADVWSAPVTRYFIIPTQTAVATEIAEREYWLDGKVADRTALGTSEAIVDLGELGTGMHSFTMRVKDDVGVWSSPVTQYFVVLPHVDDFESTLTHYVYWFNDDNAEAKSGMLEAESGIIPVSIKHLSEGRHQISWSVGDSRGKWSAVARDSFDVVHLAVTDALINLATNTFEYQAEDIEPEVTVTNEYETLTEGTDYEVEYADNRNAGTATATVRGIGFYKEEVSTEFTITKAPLTVSTTDQVREKGEENPDFPLTYEGWKGEDTDTVLTVVPVATTEATAESPVGTYDIVIGGGEALNYDLSYVGATLTVNLLLSNPMLIMLPEVYVYDARDIEPALTLMDGETPLIEGTDYEVTYANNRDAGEATFTIKGLGYYHGTLDRTFTIEKAPLTVRADDQVREQGQENPVLTFTYEGWKGTDDESVLLTVPVVTTEATADSPVGTYEILVDGGEALNYTFTYVPGVLTVKVPVGITDVRGEGAEEEWYTLGGQKLNSRPLTKGVYILNGRKVVIR